jgi:hypothetical protein
MSRVARWRFIALEVLHPTELHALNGMVGCAQDDEAPKARVKGTVTVTVSALQPVRLPFYLSVPPISNTSNINIITDHLGKVVCKVGHAVPSAALLVCALDVDAFLRTVLGRLASMFTDWCHLLAAAAGVHGTITLRLVYQCGPSRRISFWLL